MERLSRRRLLAVAAVGPPLAATFVRPRSGRAQAAPPADSVRVAPAGYDPTIAADPASGAVYVAWYRPPEADEASGQILLAGSTDGGASFGEAAVVSGEDGDVYTFTQSPPVVALGPAPAGQVYVLYALNPAHADVAFGRYVLRLARSDDGGQTFAPPTEVFADPAESGAWHDLLVASDGTLHVAWLSYRAFLAEGGAGHHAVGVAHARSRDGGATFDPGAIVDDLTCDCCRTALALAQDGTLSLAWRDQAPRADGDPVRNQVLARSVDGGRTWEAPSPIHDDGWRVAQCPESGPAIAAGPDGRLHAAWFTGKTDGAGVYHAVSADGGHTFAAPTTLVTDAFFPHANVRLALDPTGDAWVTWDDRRSVTGSFHLARVGADGTVAQTPVEGTIGVSPAIAVGPAGPLLAWRDDESILVAPATAFLPGGGG